jgi:hypothetical protein
MTIEFDGFDGLVKLKPVHPFPESQPPSKIYFPADRVIDICDVGLLQIHKILGQENIISQDDIQTVAWIIDALDRLLEKQQQIP